MYWICLKIVGFEWFYIDFNFLLFFVGNWKYSIIVLVFLNNLIVFFLYVFSNEYTIIDFIYRSSDLYENGGWIQMDKNAYISPVGSIMKYKLIHAIGIPIAPLKHCFKRKGEFHSYSLIFPALPAGTFKIDIIEKEAPGTYFNFYGIEYSKWITIPHPMDVERSNN